MISGYHDGGASRVPTWGVGAVRREQPTRHEDYYYGATRGAAEIGE